MLFNSYAFLLFFPLVVGVFYIIPQKMRNIWLLVASYYFYMCWNVKYTLLLFISTFVTYVSGILIERVKQNERIRISRQRYLKWIVAGSFTAVAV